MTLGAIGIYFRSEIFGARDDTREDSPVEISKPIRRKPVFGLSRRSKLMCRTKFVSLTNSDEDKQTKKILQNVQNGRKNCFTVYNIRIYIRTKKKIFVRSS